MIHERNVLYGKIILFFKYFPVFGSETLSELSIGFNFL